MREGGLRERLEGGGAQRIRLASLWKHSTQGGGFLSVHYSLGKKVEPSLRFSGQKQGTRQGTVNPNIHTPTPGVLRAHPVDNAPKIQLEIKCNCLRHDST